MDFFTKGYAALLGDKGQPQSPVETIDRLCDRAMHATLLEDRRAAVQGLKGLSREWKQEVGSKGMPALINLLNQDRNDIDTTKAAVETITILCSTEYNTDPTDLGYVFTDIFVKDPNNVTVLLDILEDYDFYVRFSTVKLLTTLLANRSSRLQECILTAPMGMSRLIDMLDDRREIVRNEGLLLLISLTESNADIQKIVAFDNAFERLLAIIDDEEGISGGIIVQDCLQLIQNLLRYNVSNQNYFRETSCIQRIPGLLGYVGDSAADHVQYSQEAWPEQKVANTVFVLQMIMILVEPGNLNTKTNQTVMNQCGVLLPIVQLGLCSNAPAAVRAEALRAIADIIRSNPLNQDFFGRTAVAAAPNDHHITPPVPALVALIAVAVAAGRPGQPPDMYPIRAAAAYACECCVAGNADAQVVLASTLKSPPEDNPNSVLGDKPFSAGSLLLDALQNWDPAAADPYSVWFACAILANVLRGNERAKRAAAEITFGDPEHGEEPVPLLHQITAQLMMASQEPAVNARVLVGYLALLCVWLHDSPRSVKEFLSEGVHVQFLTELVVKTSATDPVVQGLSAFLLGVAYLYDSEPDAAFDRQTLQTILLSRVGVDQFTSRLTRLRELPAVKNASRHPSSGSEEGEILDYAFVEFFKANQETVQRSITMSPSSFSTSKDSSAGAMTNEATEVLVASFQATIQKQDEELHGLRVRVAELEALLSQATVDKEAFATRASSLEDTISTERAKFATLEKEQEDLLVLMGEQDMDLKKYRRRLRTLGEEVTDDEEGEEGEEEEEGEEV